MVWIRVDEHFDEVPEHGDAELEDFGLWLVLKGYANRNLTDAFVPLSFVKRRTGARGLRVAEHMVEIGMLTRAERSGVNGFEIVRHLTDNPTRAEQESKATAKRDAGRAGGKVSGEVRRNAAKTHEPGEALASQDAKQENEAAKLRSDPSRSDPIRPDPKKRSPRPPKGGKPQGETGVEPVPPEPEKVPAEVRYAEAYARGMAKASGIAFAPIRVDKRRLVEVLVTYATDDQGAKLTGDPLLAWIEASACEYRNAKPHGEFEKGWAYAKWLEWHRAGRPREPARSGTMAIQAPGPRRLWQSGQGETNGQRTDDDKPGDGAGERRDGGDGADRTGTGTGTGDEPRRVDSGPSLAAQ